MERNIAGGGGKASAVATTAVPLASLISLIPDCLCQFLRLPLQQLIQRFFHAPANQLFKLTVTGCGYLVSAAFDIVKNEKETESLNTSAICPCIFFLHTRNIINEWYAKDTSKKIRAVFRNKGMSVSTQSPYGYTRAEDGHPLIDEETAPVVELIFQLCAEGNGPGKIARILKERRIPTPGTLEVQRTGRTRRYHPDDPCRWISDTIADILEQDSYLGRTTRFKTAKLSYRSKKKIANPPEYGKHEKERTA